MYGDKVKFESIPVSVVIPLYNCSLFIEECLTSVNQGIRPAEIIVVDDCSTDDSVALVKNLSQANSNIIILKTSFNQGAHNARKLGIDNAISPFIALIDADDVLEKDAISDAYQRIISSSLDKRIDICIWDMWRLSHNGENFRAHCNPSFLPVSGQEALKMTLGAWRIHIAGVARKEIYTRAYQNIHIDCYNSDELITRLAFCEARFVFGSPKKYFYRINPDSTTKVISDKHLGYLRSTLWLVALASRTYGAPNKRIARHGIGTAFGFLRKRGLFTKRLLKNELRYYINHVGRCPLHWRAALARPRSLFELCLLCILAKLKYF